MIAGGGAAAMCGNALRRFQRKAEGRFWLRSGGWRGCQVCRVITSTFRNELRVRASTVRNKLA
eukprot:2618309-Rhodomonas_salina.2